MTYSDNSHLRMEIIGQDWSKAEPTDRLLEQGRIPVVLTIEFIKIGAMSDELGQTPAVMST